MENYENSDRLISLLERVRSMRLAEPGLMEMKADLSLPQIGLIKWIADSPGYRLQDIAQGVGLSAPTVSVAIQRLVRKGWLERKSDPEDKRAKRIYPTLKAGELQAKFKKLRRKGIKQFLAGLEENEQDQLISLLEQALNAFDVH